MQKSYPPFLRQKGCKSDVPYCTGHAACKKLRESLLGASHRGAQCKDGDAAPRTAAADQIKVYVRY